MRSPSARQASSRPAPSSRPAQTRGERIDGERGSVTAEFAAAVPAIALVLVLCLGGVQTLAQQVRLADAAGDAVRVLARGEGAGQAEAIASAIAGVVSLAVSARGEFVCLELTAPAAFAPFGAAGVTVSARSCALEGGL